MPIRAEAKVDNTSFAGLLNDFLSIGIDIESLKQELNWTKSDLNVSTCAETTFNFIIMTFTLW